MPPTIYGVIEIAFKFPLNNPAEEGCSRLCMQVAEKPVVKTVRTKIKSPSFRWAVRSLDDLVYFCSITSAIDLASPPLALYSFQKRGIEASQLAIIDP